MRCLRSPFVPVGQSASAACWPGPSTGCPHRKPLLEVERIASKGWTRREGTNSHMPGHGRTMASTWMDGFSLPEAAWQRLVRSCRGSPSNCGRRQKRRRGGIVIVRNSQIFPISAKQRSSAVGHPAQPKWILQTFCCLELLFSRRLKRSGAGQSGVRRWLLLQSYLSWPDWAGGCWARGCCSSGASGWSDDPTTGWTEPPAWEGPAWRKHKQENPQRNFKNLDSSLFSCLLTSSRN